MHIVHGREQVGKFFFMTLSHFLPVRGGSAKKLIYEISHHRGQTWLKKFYDETLPLIAEISLAHNALSSIAFPNLHVLSKSADLYLQHTSNVSGL